MSSSQIDMLVEKYEDVVYLIFGLIGFPLFLWSSNDIKNVVNTDALLSMAIAFVIFAVFIFMFLGLISLKKVGEFPLSRKYLTAALLSLFTLPMFGISAVVSANVIFDKSTPVARTQEIIDRHESHVSRKNRDYYYVYVRPWREELDEVGVRVDESKFNSVENGNYITFKTSTGFLGIEYFVK